MKEMNHDLRFGALYCVALISLVGPGCKNNTTNLRPYPEGFISVYEKGDSVLFQTTYKPEQLLTSEGQDYGIVFSPDSQKVGLNIRMLSNLQTAKIYAIDSLGKIHSENLSARAWDIAQKDGIDPVSLLNPRAQIKKWNTTGDSVIITLTGRLENGNFLEKELKLSVQAR